MDDTLARRWIMVKFELATKEDAEILAEISKRAFHFDINYGATGEGGPYGYDSLEFQEKIIEANITSYYKILSDDTIIGGIEAEIGFEDRLLDLTEQALVPWLHNQ